jgi:hypothetical protein
VVDRLAQTRRSDSTPLPGDFTREMVVATLPATNRRQRTIHRVVADGGTLTVVLDQGIPGLPDGGGLRPRRVHMI